MVVVRYKLGLAVIILVYFTFQFFFLNHVSLGSDESLYAWYAKTIFENPASIFYPMAWEYHPPLFSVLASPLLFFFTPLASVRILSILLGGLCIILLAHLARQWGERVQLISAALLAFSQAFFFTAHWGILDTGLLLGFLITLHGAMSFVENRSMRWMAVGAAISILFKRAGFFSVLFAFCLVVLLTWKDFRLQPVRSKKWIFERALYFGWSALLFIIFFQFVRARDYFFTNSIFDIIFWNFSQLLVAVSPILLFFFIGVWLKHRNFSKIDGILFIALAAWLLQLFYPIGNYRYFLPILPILAIFAAYSFDYFIQNKLHIVQFFAVIILLLFCFANLFYITQFFLASPILIGFSESGKWLAANASNSVIYDYKERETRLLSGIELEKYGGKIREYPSSITDFRTSVALAEKPVYAVISYWGNPFAPGYVSDHFLVQEGFVLVKDVAFMYSDVNTSVIRIYRKVD